MRKKLKIDEVTPNLQNPRLIRDRIKKEQRNVKLVTVKEQRNGKS